MIPYKVKINETSGSNLGEVYKNAYRTFHSIENSTKRKPYVRSVYFKKEKIFFEYFWFHLKQKGPKERFIRLKLFNPSIELIKNSRYIPIIKDNPNNKNEMFYRFAGQTKSKLFIVQIKENKKSKRKYFMSCFSVE